MGKPCPDPSILTREFLYQAYCVEKRTIRAIARQVKCRNATVIGLLREYGLSEPVTKEWLYDHFAVQRETPEEIAEQLGCKEANVRKYLRKFAIPIKKRGKAVFPLLNDRAWLYERYVLHGLSCCQISDILNCSQSSVYRALVRFHIPIREPRIVAPGGKHVSRRVCTYHKRRLIYQRDGFVCQWPGCGSTLHLEAHHIIPIRSHGTNALENGITLCEVCHRKTLGRELQLAPLFQSILESGAAHSVSTPIQLRLF